MDDVFDSSVYETSDHVRSAGEFSMCDRSISETNVHESHAWETSA